MKPFNKFYHLPGTAPGTLVESEEGADIQAHSTLWTYNGAIISYVPNTEADVISFKPADEVDHITWLDTVGNQSTSRMQQLGESFGLHKLALEDVLNAGQRPKLDVHEKHLFIVLNLPKMVGDDIELEQISLFVGKHGVLSFCQGDGAIFDPVRKRLKDSVGRLRKQDANYLLYALMDSVIDAAFPILEELGEAVEDLEARILEVPDKEVLTELHRVRRDLLLLRRGLWPHREVLSHLLRDDEGKLDQEHRPYFSDCYDHAIQIIDLIETYREMLGGLLDVYLSSASNRMNDVMRLLTIISTIFIPLTFLAGVYGMNFANMPELQWPYAYPTLWAVMIGIVAVMVWLFRRKNWL
jgi:magnesium transporter